MKVVVVGLWHLGTVTAACLASAGHSVAAFDPDTRVVEGLAAGQSPVAEPGLPELIQSGIKSRALKFLAERADAIRDAEIVWITFDTPVSEDDVADVDAVVRQVEACFPHISDRAVIVCSSQLPVGTIRSLERAWTVGAGGRTVSFACCPENLRLGKALDTFRNPDRVIVGVRDEWARARVRDLFSPITDRLEWMSVESAEMTKHAVNAFLATSVTFINEIATLCERVGADAREVERGLRTERRIGPRAYLGPGAAFAGGTLARDVTFLQSLGVEVDRPTPLMNGVLASNAAHGLWARRKLESSVAPLAGTKVAIWGLTYKPGTDTLRRSPGIELCKWLVSQGADVHVHDPAVRNLPDDLPVVRHQDPLDAVAGARALVVATSWPSYGKIDAERLASIAPDLLVIDANRFLGAVLDKHPGFRLVSVGQP